MPIMQAVLFDFGGTLFNYETVAPGERESIVDLARWAGATVDTHAILRAYRSALKHVFYEYLPRPYYLHRDLFRDVLQAMARDLGIVLTEAHFAQYRQIQCQRRERDFTLREGVLETLTELRDRGYHLGIVSNIDDDQLEHMIGLSGLERHFHSILSSERAQSCKPDLRIFTEALQRAQCAPEEAFFVGDSLQQDIPGANRMGMHSVLIWDRTDSDPPFKEAVPRSVIQKIPELLDLAAKTT
ncbi:MAG: HAD family hydrolase [Candidatus Binatia bacterium]